jgi:hypothetical protein
MASPRLPGSSSPEVPIEVYEVILQNHERDIPTLTNCTLVCESWRALVQPWIFRKISLSAEHAPYPRLQTLKELAMESPHLTDYIHTLSFRPLQWGHLLGSGEFNSSSKFFRVLDDEKVFQFLSNVKSLELDFSCIPSLKEEAIQLFSRLRKVEHLQLAGDVYSSFDYLMHSFPLLKSICLDGANFREDIRCSVALEKVQVSLTSINYDSFLPRHSEASSLQHFTLRWRCPVVEQESRQAVVKLLRTVPPQVRTLTLWKDEMLTRDIDLNVDDTLGEYRTPSLSFSST